MFVGEHAYLSICLSVYLSIQIFFFLVFLASLRVVAVNGIGIDSNTMPLCRHWLSKLLGFGLQPVV